ncbi:MAG: transposase [Bacteroidales bacterium]|nr:transposase [Bacteroidales bacterium]
MPEDKGIVIGNLPSLPIPRGNVGPDLLAHITVSKFVDHLPFYRQAQQFRREGIQLSESTPGGICVNLSRVSIWTTVICFCLIVLGRKYFCLQLAIPFLRPFQFALLLLLQPENLHRMTWFFLFQPFVF